MKKDIDYVMCIDENGKRKINNDVVKDLAEYYNIKVSNIVD